MKQIRSRRPRGPGSAAHVGREWVRPEPSQASLWDHNRDLLDEINKTASQSFDEVK